MYLRDLGASLLRRWPLVLVCLALTAGICFFVGQKVQPSYETTASTLLVPPKSTETPKANRYLLLGGMSPAVDVLTRSLNSDETHGVIKAGGATGKYTVESDGSTSAPIFIITSTAPTKKQAQQTLDAVLDRVPVNLEVLQKGLTIADDSQITAQLVSQESEPDRLYKQEIRILGALAALGVLGSCVLVGAADSLLIRRRPRAEDVAEAVPVEARGEDTPRLRGDREDADRKEAVLTSSDKR